MREKENRVCFLRLLAQRLPERALAGLLLTALLRYSASCNISGWPLQLSETNCYSTTLSSIFEQVQNCWAPQKLRSLKNSVWNIEVASPLARQQLNHKVEKRSLLAPLSASWRDLGVSWRIWSPPRWRVPCSVSLDNLGISSRFYHWSHASSVRCRRWELTEV